MGIAVADPDREHRSVIEKYCDLHPCMAMQVTHGKRRERRREEPAPDAGDAREDDFRRKLARVDEHLIGLWRFRRPDAPAHWCATFHHNGFYYDVSGKESIHSALDAVHDELERLRDKRRRR